MLCGRVASSLRTTLKTTAKRRVTMSPEKPVTPPEEVVLHNGNVFKIIPGSEDVPETETAFGGHTTHAMAWVDGLRQINLAPSLPPPRLHHRRRSRAVELPYYNSFDVSLVKSCVSIAPAPAGRAIFPMSSRDFLPCPSRIIFSQLIRSSRCGIPTRNLR